MYATMTLFQSNASDVASWSQAVKARIKDSFFKLPADVTIALVGLFCVLRFQEDNFTILQLMSFFCRVRTFLNDLIGLQSSQEGATTILSQSNTFQLVRDAFDTERFRELSRELGLEYEGDLQQDLQSAWVGEPTTTLVPLTSLTSSGCCGKSCSVLVRYTRVFVCITWC
jgi:hypothetical protein